MRFLKEKGSMSIPLALVGSLLGSVILASASYFGSITAQKVQATELSGKIELVEKTNNQTNAQQDKDITKINENIGIVNENVSKLLIKMGETPKQIKL